MRRTLTGPHAQTAGADRRAAEIEQGVGMGMGDDDEDDGDEELARAIAASIGGTGANAFAPPPPFRPPPMSPPTHLRNLVGGGGDGMPHQLPTSGVEPPPGGMRAAMMPPGFPPPAHLAGMQYPCVGGFGGGVGMSEEQILMESLGRSAAEARAPPVHPLSAPGEMNGCFDFI